MMSPFPLNPAVEEILRRQRQIADLANPTGLALITEQIRRTRDLTRIIDMDAYGEVLAVARNPEWMQAIRAMDPLREIAAQARFGLPKFVSPNLEETIRLADIVSERVKAFEILSPTGDWSRCLSERMGLIQADWAFGEGVEESAEAFARLSRLSDVTRGAVAYADDTTEVLVEELGALTESPSEPETIELREERYDDAGRDPSLIAFPPPAFSGIMVSAGFAAAFPPPPEIVVEGGLIDPVHFSPESGAILQSLEAHLRELVTRLLSAADGATWIKRRVAPGPRAKWAELQEAARLAGKPVFPLIQYAHFMELADIIADGRNWPLFEACFLRKDNLRLSLGRLYTIRNDIAHARPISMTDALIVVTEGTLLFRAMGLPVQFRQ
jgi:Swt1-like HEPN